MDNYLHLPFIRSSPIDLVITRYPEVFSIVPRILCAYCLAVLCHMNNPRIIPRTYRVSAHPQLFRCFTKVFEILFNPPKILSSFIALQILVCLHYGCFPYVWQYSLVSLDTVILILLIQHVCECTQSSVDPYKLSFWLRRLSNMSWFSANQIAIDCTPKSIQLIHP